MLNSGVKNGANMTNVDGDVVGTPKELDGIRFSKSIVAVAK